MTKDFPQRRAKRCFERYLVVRTAATSMEVLAIFLVFCATVSFAGPVLSDQPEPELMDGSLSNPSQSNLEILASSSLPQTDVEDLDTVNDNRHHHKHHHRHHHRHHHPNDTENDDEFEFKHPSHLHVASEHVEMCEKGRIPDESDVTWKNDNCETCHCSGSTVTCQREACPDLPCKNPAKVENECCEVCPEKICEAADGRRFRDGAEWHLDDCTFCECRKGRVLCSVEDCEYKACADPVKIPGQCCPVCPDTSCHEDNGSNHTAGAVWKEGECTHCYCRQGEKVCAEEKCPHINCSHPYRRSGECCYRCPGAVECVVSAWGSWGECPIQECGGGMRRRYRSVVIAPRNGGSFCPHMSEAQMCPRLPCNDVPVCPVTAWGSWSHCTATCGVGRRLRMRQKAKVTKTTMTSLIDCSKTHMQESMRCYTGTCNVQFPLRQNEPAEGDHCLNATWSDWEPCSVACGVGVRTRKQRLVNSSHPLGHLCHLLRETKQCHGHDCSGSHDNPVHCKVTQWSPWTPCSVTCGERAAKSKHRSILRHPSPEGRPCPRLTMSRSCRLPPCEISMLNLPDSDDRCVSEDGTHHYSENERWDPIECVSCRCVNSRKICQPMLCPKPECTNPIKYPGFCCPFCFGG